MARFTTALVLALVGTTAGLEEAGETQLYSCEVGAEEWETVWTPDWKAWCCLHHPPLGCPSTTTATQTSTTATTTTITSSTSTVTVTTSSTSTVTTKTSTSTWTWTSTTTASENWCLWICKFDGKSATCGDRIKFASEQMTMNEWDPMQAASDLVNEQCDFCSACSVEAVRAMNTDEISVKYEARDDGFLSQEGRAVTPAARISIPSVGIALCVLGFAGIAVVTHRRRHRGQLDAQCAAAESGTPEE